MLARVHAAALSRYLLLPLRGASLSLIVSFSLLLIFASMGGLLGMPLALIVLSWFSKYAFVLLDAVTEGVVDPPVLSVEMVNPLSEQRPLALLILAGGFWTASAQAMPWVGESGVTVLRLAGVLVLPAIIAIQGATGSVVQSLNPVGWVKLMLGLRSSYLWVLALIFVVWIPVRALLSMNPEASSPHGIQIALPAAIRIALIMYAWLATFTLIGAALFERRDDIGLEAAHAPERRQAKLDAERDKARDRIMDRVYAEWRGGARGNAWRTVEAQKNASTDPVSELRWMHRSAGRWPAPDLANRIAQELLPLLLAQRLHGEALDVVRERLRRDAGFRPLAGADVIRLAELARDAGDRPGARMLLSDFATRFPNDSGSARATRLNEQLSR